MYQDPEGKRCLQQSDHTDTINNKTVDSSGHGTCTDDEYYKTRILELNKEIMALNMKNKTLNNENQNLNNELAMVRRYYLICLLLRKLLLYIFL